MRTLYLDASYGISGDMAVAALAELAPESLKQEVLEVLQKLNLAGLKVNFSRRKRGALDCTSFDVELEHDNHDHDLNYLHHNLDHDLPPHEHTHSHDHPHEHEHLHEHPHEYEHLHEHEHPHEHDHHSHVHRNLHDVTKIINDSSASDKAKALAIKIFSIVAYAEAKAHGASLDEVHFHEVGALDSIADILAFACFYTGLGIEKTIIPSITEGFGKIRCQHGVLEIPVPAVVNIMVEHALPLKFSQIEGELITPTGAAIAAAIRSQEKALPKEATIVKAGFGAGKRDYAKPTYLRALLLEEASQDTSFIAHAAGEKEIIKIETNIDDASAENLGFLMEKLFAAKALDVFFTPIFMKKMRPATLITVICESEHFETLKKLLLKESTSIGLRFTTMQRFILPREIITFNSTLGEIKVKQVDLSPLDNTKSYRYYPEYESIKDLSLKHNLAYVEVLDLVKAQLRQAFFDHDK